MLYKSNFAGMKLFHFLRHQWTPCRIQTDRTEILRGHSLWADQSLNEQSFAVDRQEYDDHIMGRRSDITEPLGASFLWEKLNTTRTEYI